MFYFSKYTCKHLYFIFFYHNPLILTLFFTNKNCPCPLGTEQLIMSYLYLHIIIGFCKSVILKSSSIIYRLQAFISLTSPFTSAL